MSQRSSVSGQSPAVTVSFGERYLCSERFQSIYREGMELVEHAARYLDGDGRREGKQLTGPAALSFATESMRLTTRLMNLASWLLIRRSVNNREMTQERARRERLKLKLDTIGRPSHVKAYDELPEKLRMLIELSYALQDKIVKLDRLFEDGGVLGNNATLPVQPQENAVIDTQNRIRLVFDAAKAARH